MLLWSLRCCRWHTLPQALSRNGNPEESKFQEYLTNLFDCIHNFLRVLRDAWARGKPKTNSAKAMKRKTNIPLTWWFWMRERALSRWTENWIGEFLMFARFLSINSLIHFSKFQRKMKCSSQKCLIKMRNHLRWREGERNDKCGVWLVFFSCLLEIKSRVTRSLAARRWPGLNME